MPNPTTRRVRMLPDGRMDTRNAARYLGVAPHTLANRRSHDRCHGTDRGPPYIKLGGQIFYRKADLDAWIGQADTALKDTTPDRDED